MWWPLEAQRATAWRPGWYRGVVKAWWKAEGDEAYQLAARTCGAALKSGAAVGRGVGVAWRRHVGAASHCRAGGGTRTARWAVGRVAAAGCLPQGPPAAGLACRRSLKPRTPTQTRFPDETSVRGRLSSRTGGTNRGSAAGTSGASGGGGAAQAAACGPMSRTSRRLRPAAAAGCHQHHCQDTRGRAKRHLGPPTRG